MFPFNQSRLFKPFLVAMAVILSLSGIVVAVQPVVANAQSAAGAQQAVFQTIPTLTPSGSAAATLAPGQLFDLNRLQGIQNPYDNCGLLYAIQSQDTLDSIATVFGTTTAQLTNLNTFLDQNQLVPGMVICIAPVPNIVIPPTGQVGQPGINVVSVNPGQTVTFHGVNFPAGDLVNVQMLDYSALNPSVYVAGTFVVPQSDNFQVQFNIPSQLANTQLIRTRFLVQATGETASTVFRNISPAGGGIPSNLCTQFYTVQSGDRLVNIANQFNTTVTYLSEINNIANPNLIYPGERLCVDTNLQIPSTGSYNPALTVVKATDDVTVRGSGFPGNNTFRVIVGVRDHANVQPVQTATYTTPLDGSFQQYFNIPEPLLKYRNLYVRFEQINGTVVAEQDFANSLAQYGGNTPTPQSGQNPTSTPEPTTAPTNMPTVEPTAQSTVLPTVLPTSEATVTSGM